MLDHNLPKYKRVQLEFTNYIRNPEQAPLPSEVDPDRVKMYAGFIFDNIEEFLAQAYPVTKKIYEEKAQWRRLVRSFISNHRAKSPYFCEIAREFLDYLEVRKDSSDAKEDVPFLQELCHYEWIELALEIEIESSPFDAHLHNKGSFDLDASPMKCSPLAWSFMYHYPVHKICVDFQPKTPSPEPYYLVIYRNVENMVKFMQLNALGARALHLLREKSYTGSNLLTQLINELSFKDKSLFMKEGGNLLKKLVDKDIILVS